MSQAPGVPRRPLLRSPKKGPQALVAHTVERLERPRQPLSLPLEARRVALKVPLPLDLEPGAGGGGHRLILAPALIQAFRALRSSTDRPDNARNAPGCPQTTGTTLQPRALERRIFGVVVESHERNGRRRGLGDADIPLMALAWALAERDL